MCNSGSCGKGEGERSRGWEGAVVQDPETLANPEQMPSLHGTPASRLAQSWPVPSSVQIAGRELPGTVAGLHQGAWTRGCWPYTCLRNCVNRARNPKRKASLCPTSGKKNQRKREQISELIPNFLFLMNTRLNYCYYCIQGFQNICKCKCTSRWCFEYVSLLTL